MNDVSCNENNEKTTTKFFGEKKFQQKVHKKKPLKMETRILQ